MPVQFTYAKGFVKDFLRLRKRFHRIEADIEALKAELRRAHRGELMTGYGLPLYKVRMANRSARRGKRGGFRVIYRFQNSETILFMHIYSKTEKENVSPSEINRMLRE